MKNIVNEIETVKKTYLAEIKEKTTEFSRVFIYGAGHIARELYSIFAEENIRIDGFVVTDGNINVDELFGLKVFDIESLVYEQDEVFIVLGVKNKWSNEVLNQLEMHKIMNYIVAPEFVEFFSEKNMNWFLRPKVEVTTKIGCSVNCKYCPQSLLIRRYHSDKRQMKYQDYVKCVDKLPRDTVLIFAGYVEPFLNKECSRMIQYAHEAGFEMKVLTTLVGLTLEAFKEIKNIPFSEFTLHVPDKDGLAKIPMTDEYYSVLEEVISWKKANGEQMVESANCQSQPHEAIVERTKGRLKIFSEMADRAGNLENEELFSIEHEKGPVFCKQSLNINHNILLPDGSLVLCCMDYGLEHVLGNLLSHTYQEVLDSDVKKSIVRKMQSENLNDILCKKCHFACQF